MKITIGLCLMFLSACVSQSTVLMNERGQAVRCQNWGFGVIGAPLAYAEHRECVKNANAAGYTVPAQTHEQKPTTAKSYNPNGT